MENQQRLKKDAIIAMFMANEATKKEEIVQQLKLCKSFYGACTLTLAEKRDQTLANLETVIENLTKSPGRVTKQQKEKIQQIVLYFV